MSQRATPKKRTLKRGVSLRREGRLRAMPARSEGGRGGGEGEGAPGAWGFHVHVRRFLRRPGRDRPGLARMESQYRTDAPGEADPRALRGRRGGAAAGPLEPPL